MRARKLENTDKETFLKYCHRFYQSGAALHEIEPGNFEKTFYAALEEKAGLLGFAIDGADGMAGYSLVNSFWSSEAGGVVYMIDELYIDAKYQGQGLGSEFLKWLFSDCSDAAAFRLEVCDANDGAIRLYRRMGFDWLPYKQMLKA